MSAAGTTNRQDEEEIDLANIERIRTLMQNDPKFITRLITQLDNQMKSIADQKQKRLDQIAADEEEIRQIDNAIERHIKPNLDRLSEGIRSKDLVRDEAAKGLAEQTKNLRDLERDAAALILAARTKSTKLHRKTAADRLTEARGFNCSTPTTTILRGTKRP